LGPSSQRRVRKVPRFFVIDMIGVTALSAPLLAVIGGVLI